MLRMFRAGRGSVLVWGLMGLLFVGLAGFGIGTGALVQRDIAQVGSREVTAEAYRRALDQEMRAISTQLGRSLTMDEAREFGIDRMVLARLISDAALDVEAERLGLAASDAVIAEQIQATPAFQGAGGTFDRDTYRYALERTGLTPPQFETLLGAEATRELIAASVQSAASLPDTAALTLMGFLGERRAFDWLRLDASDLESPVARPSDAVLANYHSRNEDRYTRPETQRIAYAILSPEALAETIELDEATLRAAYDAAPDRFGTPERRIVDRIGFRDAQEAEAAKARLDADETDFDALAAARGLNPEDIDQGALGASDLDAGPREIVFNAPGPGIVGPVDTPLGPSLYRINAITAARVTPYEEARDALARDAALGEARDRIAAQSGTIADLVAGGATLEELAAETEMEPGTIALNADSTGPLAADPAFRQAAEDARDGEETDLATLADGSLVSLRVEGVDPAAPIPLAEIRDRVAADWTAAETAERLEARADVLTRDADGIAAAADALDRPLRSAGPLTRGDTVADAPAELIADVFAAEQGAIVERVFGDGVILAEVTRIEPFDHEAAENAEVFAAVSDQLRDQAADDLLALFSTALRDEAGVSIDAGLLESTLAELP